MTFRTQEDIMQYWTSKSDAPMVSIRCITYNHESFIAQALDSFLMQKTVFPFEIVVHDDASSDKTANIVREYEKKYPDIIKPIYEEENQYSKNVAHFRKVVDDACKGKYIAYCEGDDYWIEPDKLQVQVDWLESHPEHTMCCSDAIIESPNGILDWHRYEKDCDIPVKDMILGGGQFVQTATIVYRRDILNNYPDVCLKCHVGDFPLQLWAVLNGKVRYIAQKTASYRYFRSGSWTSNQRNFDIKKLIHGWQSEIDMLDYLNKYSKNDFSHYFQARKELYLHGLLKSHENYWATILKNINIGKKFTKQKKIEGFLIKINCPSIANSYLLLTQKKYKDALYSLPILRKIVPFIYFKIFKKKIIPQGSLK